MCADVFGGGTWHLHFPLPLPALWEVLGSGVGSLHRVSYVRGLVQVKMHLTLIQQHSPHSLSSPTFPSFCEVPPNVLWKGLFSHINEPSPIFAIVHGSSKETSSVG